MQLKIHMLTIEDLVPADHLLRKIDAALDFSFVYEETSSLYQRRYGRPPIDPVVMVKYLLIGFLYGIPSERQIEQRCADSNAFRWYLGVDLDERVPDHSTISQLRRRKPSFRKVFRRLFEEVVRQCVEKRLVSGKLMATDSTHVKANASRASEYLAEVREEPGAYWERLDTYEEEGLAELERRTGKRRKKRVKQIKRDKRRSHKRVSRTDPEAGHMKRPGKPRGQYYLSQKHLPFQLHIGTVMGRLGPDKESDAMLLQHPVGQGEVIGRVCGRGLDGNYVLMDMFQLLQVRNRIVHISRRYGHASNDAAVCICGLVGEIILASWLAGALHVAGLWVCPADTGGVFL